MACSLGSRLWTRISKQIRFKPGVIISRNIIMTAATSVEANTVPAFKIVEENYENAVKTLNTLQSNAQTLAKARQNLDIKRFLKASLTETLGALKIIGLKSDIIDSLNIIHVAGTKGKGTTCAFTESILRNAGLKTGFFSSPHLTAVRERIRINGKPLSTEAFATYFFDVYKKLQHLKKPDAPIEMPHYFRFLTCMALHVFLQEKVDVVVLEVGIGGMYDSTNCIRNPVVVGITNLGLEHQSVLGQTLEEIAIQKAGIMKPGVLAYTVENHPPHILDLLRSYASSVQCTLSTVSTLDIKDQQITLGVNGGTVSRQNAALAVHLANEFLLRKYPNVFPYLPQISITATELKYSISRNFLPFQVEGLRSTKWDGRYQVITASDQLKYYLDGAHTVDSINLTINWFKNVAVGAALRILVFSVTGGRSAQDFLEIFASSRCIDVAIFCPIIAYSAKPTPDNWSAVEIGKDVLEECRQQVQIWESFGVPSKGVVCDSIESTIQYISTLVSKDLSHTGIDENQNVCTSVLVTGSLHLVGSFLSVLDPTRNEV